MKPLLTVALLAALALAGCTGSGGGDGDFVVPPTDSEGRYVIHMTDGPYRFEPAQAMVPAGATVVWTNNGDIAHNVRADDGAWQHGAADTDDFQITTTDAMIGVHPYVCEPHQSLGMTGELKVLSQADFDAMSEDGL